MRELYKTKNYYLGDLSKEQKDTLREEAGTQEHNRINLDTFKYMCYRDEYKTWLYSDNPDLESVNALELFFTLENIQVDCTGLTQDQIEKMCDLVDLPYFEGKNFAMSRVRQSDFLVFKDDMKYLTTKQSDLTTITYGKFIELFGKPKRKPYSKELSKKEPTLQGTYVYSETKPKHYSKGIDTFARMESNCTLEERLAFAKGNIDKYTWREKGQDKEDFVKIIKYAEWALKQINNELGE